MAVEYASNSYYADEHRVYSDIYSVYISDGDVDLILKKLCRRFGVRIPTVKFRGHRDSGYAGRRVMQLSHKPSLGLVIHEFSHMAHSQSSELIRIISKVNNTGTAHHGRHYQVILRRVVDYARSKDLWEVQLKRRAERRDSAEKAEKAKVKKKRRKIRRQKDLDYYW